MEISQVKAFLVVADELHFGRAADKLRVAQPHLSRVIRQFERDCGGVLFERSTRRVELTDMGRAMLEPTRALLEAVDEVQRTAKAAAEGKMGRVRIGLGGLSNHDVIGELARLMRIERPGVQLEIRTGLFDHKVFEGVRNGTLDFAITRLSDDCADLSSRTIGVDRLLLAVPAESDLAKLERVSFSDLVNERFVSLPTDGGSVIMRRLFLHGGEAGFVPQIAQVVPDSHAMMVLVAAGIGVGVTVNSVRERMAAQGVAFCEFDDEIPWLNVRVVWRTEDRNPALQAVLPLLERAVPEYWRRP